MALFFYQKISSKINWSNTLILSSIEVFCIFSLFADIRRFESVLIFFRVILRLVRICPRAKKFKKFLCKIKGAVDVS